MDYPYCTIPIYRHASCFLNEYQWRAMSILDITIEVFVVVRTFFSKIYCKEVAYNALTETYSSLFNHVLWGGLVIAKVNLD